MTTPCPACASKDAEIAGLREGWDEARKRWNEAMEDHDEACDTLGGEVEALRGDLLMASKREDTLRALVREMLPLVRALQGRKKHELRYVAVGSDRYRQLEDKKRLPEIRDLIQRAEQACEEE